MKATSGRFSGPDRAVARGAGRRCHPVPAALAALGLGALWPAAASEGVVELEARLATADPVAGAEAFGICGACHSDERDGEAMIGPGLWGIVGKKVGSEPGFDYSDALLAFGGEWTLERLYRMIENPNAMIPGNTMGFYGIRNAQDRIDILAYLVTLADPAEE
jgi:cytochrome c